VRELDPADRRSFRLRLTPSGQTVTARVAQTLAELEEAALEGLSKEQIDGFHAVLEALS
jgi:DNA-binding MarR family transcriptional regulator